MKADEFFNNVKNKFKFLEDQYNFNHYREVDEEDYYQVFYKGRDIGVSIYFEFRDFIVLVYFHKLENGNFVMNLKNRPEILFDSNFVLEMTQNMDKIYPQHNLKTVLNSNLVLEMINFEAQKIDNYCKKLLMQDLREFNRVIEFIRNHDLNINGSHAKKIVDEFLKNKKKNQKE